MTSLAPVTVTLVIGLTEFDGVLCVLDKQRTVEREPLTGYTHAATQHLILFDATLVRSCALEKLPDVSFAVEVIAIEQTE